ncbi:MAG: hypothetical protein BGO76_06780 [Caedibacter sp. 38-128]|nr:hypothetical protein [Holosporales bacterium]OJX03839.1 MAG: hypothetical protein BGO76_06780 [Caedibacter sp. 38-128]
MKVRTFLALSALTVTTTTLYAGESLFENDNARPLRSRPAQKDLLGLPSLKTTKTVMKTKELLEANYKRLGNAQRKQKIAEKKQRQENQKKIKMIENLPAEGIDTLNVAQFMKVMFWYPTAENPDLDDAIIFKTNKLYAEKRSRKYLEALDRKNNYIDELNEMFFKVNQEAKKWELDNYGYRQVVKPSRPSAQSVFETPKAQKRQFAKKMKIWTKKARAVAAAA